MSPAHAIETAPTWSGADADDWRGFRVYGPDGYVGTVDECLSVLAGGVDVLRVRAGLFVRRSTCTPVAAVVRIVPAERRIHLSQTPREWLRQRA